MAAAAILIPGCPSKLPAGAPALPPFPTTGTICSSVSYTIPAGWKVTAPPTGLPNWLTYDATNQTLSGTPQGNDYGDFKIAMTISYGGKSVTDSGTISIPPPTVTPTGGPFAVPLSGSNTSNVVTVTIAPACSATFTLTKVEWSGNQINLPNPAQLVLPATGTNTLQVSMETDVPGTGSVTGTLEPTGQYSGTKASFTIPLTASH